MENLHLKNLNKPNGKYLFDKLYDLKENFKKHGIDELISDNLNKPSNNMVNIESNI